MIEKTMKTKTHNFHKSTLRAYDIRGIVGETLSPEDAYYIGRAFGTFVLKQNKGNKVCVGFDGRHSSPELEEKLVRGLQESGIDVFRIGLGPTPMLYFSVKHLKASGGIMITGSHNPPSHNGFKMMLDKMPLFGSDITGLGDIATGGDFVEGSGSVEFVDVREDYLKHLLSSLTGGRELKIAWDAGNGAAGQVMQELAVKLPGEHILLNEKIDGNFPAHHPDPSVAENMQQLIDEVREKKCDLGIAFDGDGDRIGVVDEKGEIIFGDRLMVLYARDILASHPDETIITDVKTSQILFDEIKKAGGRPLMWKTGHSLIKTKMFETNAIFGGEMSGHIFFRENNGFDDGLYAAVRLINIAAESDLPLSEILGKWPDVYDTGEMRIDADDERKFVIVDEIKARLTAAKADVNDIDGVRVKSADGWWLLRASNTQAALVARCESKSDDGLSRLKRELGEQLKKSGIAV